MYFTWKFQIFDYICFSNEPDMLEIHRCSPEVHVWLAAEYAASKIPPRPPTLREIFDEIMVIFDAKESDVINARRFTDNVRLRQLFCYVATHVTKATQQQIGNFIGRDHSTVLVSINKVQGFIDVKDESFMGIFNYYRHTSKIWRDKP